MNTVKLVVLLFIFNCYPSFTYSQELPPQEVSKLITSYKNDLRGPYHRIKWFCEDGTEREPKDPCPDGIGGGIQHASFKASALQLRRANHLFFGEILGGLKPNDFLDRNANYSRLKQYQIGNYLSSVDNGWVLRKAQYYRGAIQSEDEEAWGKDFFINIVADDEFIIQNYYLLRQSLKDIPHNGDDNIAQLMRSQSKILSEDHPSFMDIRIKIHGQPQASDIRLVNNYLQSKKTSFTEEASLAFEDLVKTMHTFYAPIDFKDLKSDLSQITEQNEATASLSEFLKNYSKDATPDQLTSALSNVLYAIRTHITDFKYSKNRLAILDLSNQLENILLKEAQKWDTTNLSDNLYKINTLACATLGSGLIEEWEYYAIASQFTLTTSGNTTNLKQLNAILNTSRSIVEWTTTMVKANYQDEVNIYTKFEPLAYGFIDDRVRSSISLNLGEEVSKLGVLIAKVSNINNAVVDLKNQTTIRGLNPGYAFGKLVVVDGNPEDVSVHSNNIYIFEKPPSDLKPIAGIMTVSEGNLVSHVQLLARNLGIPNAVLSYENLKDLKAYDGKKVFYAVSNQGHVILKFEDDMTSEEKDLFFKKESTKNRIAVPVENIKLDTNEVLNMRAVRAVNSGEICGPKAANLGELKHLFPEQVVEGLVIPFGVFRAHMDQQMPGENKSYWSYLNETFNKAEALRTENSDEETVEAFQLENLRILHKAIINMQLSATFEKDLKANFKDAFKGSIGTVPVFLRSDTNMEDLKEFTGAGLNLTLFNILLEDGILKGIKQVWASAYTERSFKWRQKYLLNPENVFPSILIIPSVDVDYSGVMITKGINSGNTSDVTVAFSRGAGGAVDGQLAETRLITEDASELLAPARQPNYIRLPENGGTKTYYTSYNAPILNDKNIEDIKALAKSIRKTMDPNSVSEHAFDVEFGFKNNELWLFQIRPFVENKQAKSSEYLISISPRTNVDRNIALTTAL
ncbi:phosphoenolpyruvate synthase [Bizionia gelidisalsuginis]|uniref:Phosphoenolpyruvate synthase n=2 Tax=Bizionia TaxID=283785 RepID=A0A8H2LFA9_9FLAO|nr:MULTISPECIES: PEP/pyruvate-binding domain-containing protein [Bizionia]TYB76712.1 phosphoenolpyruvate synthase [Bizionia saleffrena]TYC14091.1 phosphoenolpyruvate synthase [Bizionia gelidisalsuginis]